jgi:hypothetical protein
MAASAGNPFIKESRKEVTFTVPFVEAGFKLPPWKEESGAPCLFSFPQATDGNKSSGEMFKSNKIKSRFFYIEFTSLTRKPVKSSDVEFPRRK